MYHYESNTRKNNALTKWDQYLSMEVIKEWRGKDSSCILLNAKHDPQQSEESALYKRRKNK
jgi:hypothetical protein